MQSLFAAAAVVAAALFVGETALADPAAATRFDAAVVRAAFARGTPLLETGAYKIHASRREAPGQAEVHRRDTDLIYVLEGGATFVTGGAVVDGAETAPDEVRGPSIAGGTAQELAPGDVVVVPSGTPHWFQSVRGPFLYYVVKVTDGGAQ